DRQQEGNTEVFHRSFSWLRRCINRLRTASASPESAVSGGELVPDKGASAEAREELPEPFEESEANWLVVKSQLPPSSRRNCMPTAIWSWLVPAASLTSFWSIASTL